MVEIFEHRLFRIARIGRRRQPVASLLRHPEPDRLLSFAPGAVRAVIKRIYERNMEVMQRQSVAGRLIPAAFGIAVLVAAVSTARAEPPSPPVRADIYVNRLEVLALIETLSAEILASRSATQTLEAWCASHHMAPDTKIHARLVAGAVKDISPDGRQRLDVAEDTMVKYRRVELTCGDHVLSQADNWYVPERLTKDMNAALETSDRPFGYVVKELAPRRLTFAADLLWRPLPDGFETQPIPPDHPDQQLVIPPLLFEHRAILVKPDGQPFSLVVETYRRDILDFARAR
jgi:chorismate-pyruvate lyase